LATFLCASKEKSLGRDSARNAVELTSARRDAIRHWLSVLVPGLATQWCSLRKSYGDQQEMAAQKYVTESKVLLARETCLEPVEY
jgi:hypothetical protein